MLAQQIIGIWELERWQTVIEDHVADYPLGDKATGIIAYHPQGFMSVNLSAPHRVRLPTNDPFDGDPKLLALDAKGYLSYCGPFTVLSEGEVVHHLRFCSFENWVGTDQHRYAKMDGDALILSTPPALFRGKKGVGRLTWKRIRDLK